MKIINIMSTNSQKKTHFLWHFHSSFNGNSNSIIPSARITNRTKATSKNEFREGDKQSRLILSATDKLYGLSNESLHDSNIFVNVNCFAFSINDTFYRGALSAMHCAEIEI